MPQLFARLAGEYSTSEEALDQTKKMSDKAFSESAENEISRVRGILAYHLEQPNWLLRLQIQGELEEGVARVTKSEEKEADDIMQLKLQEVRDFQVAQAQEKVEQLKQEAIKASEAQFVWTPCILFFVSLTSCQVEKLSRAESMKGEEQRRRKARVC